MKIEEVLTKLKELDLSTYPASQIRELMNQFGIMCSMQVFFHPGKVVMRARPHENDSIRFFKKDDFSFKPQQFNTTYQRASTPNQTMFYATAIPEDIEPGELDSMRIIGVVESLPQLRDSTSSLYKKISFGRWEVAEDLRLLAIIHKENYFSESSFTRELVNAYNEATSNIPPDILAVEPDIIEKSLLIQSYLADEFSKESINADYDYMISAIFSEIATTKGFDGIFYPSVRVGGKGFNIAITPEATKKLKLVVAGECSLYKYNDHTMVGNDAIVTLQGDEDDFKLIDLEDNSQEDLLNILGVASLEELQSKTD